MKTDLKRFILLIPERGYKFDADQCSHHLLLQSRSINNAEFGRVHKARTPHDKVVELCSIMAEHADSETAIAAFVEALELVGSNTDLATNLRLEIQKSTASINSEAKKIRFYGDFPLLPKALYSRNEENVLRESLSRLCKKSKHGALAVHGNRGVGKTTLVRSLLLDEAFLLKKCGVSTVVWLHCGHFISPKTGLFDPDLFYTELLAGLLQVHLEASSYCQSPQTAGVSTVFDRLQAAAFSNNSNNQVVLVVLDGASNAELIPLTLRIGPSLRCLAICHDRKALSFRRDDLMVVEQLGVDKMAEADIINMFKGACPLPKNGLNSTQIKTLADCCDGLPLIASLIASNFGDCHEDALRTDARFARLTAHFNSSGMIDVEDILQAAIEDEHLQHNAIELIRACLQSLPKKWQQDRYHDAFLLFDPEQPVEPSDMAVIWQCSQDEAAEICADLHRRGLLVAINSVDSTGAIIKVTRKYAMHSLLYRSLIQLADGPKIDELRFFLVDSSSSPNEENILHRAVRQHRRLVVETLLMNVDASTTLQKLCGEQTGEQQQTPLHYLYRNGWRISTGTYNETNYSMLMFCQFVDKLAQLNRRDALAVLQLKDADGIALALLIKRDVKERCRTDDNVLFMAAQGGFVSLINLMLNLRIDIARPVNENGDPALLIAAQNGHSSVVQVLIGSGVDVNVRNKKNGSTALMVAALRHDLELAQLFFDSQANINACNDNGDTSLILAAQTGDAEFVEAFLENGANANVKNKAGESVLLQIARTGTNSTEMAWKLIVCGADVNTSNDYGHTPLILAAKEGHVEMAKLLLAQPTININARNVYQMTALMAAASSGNVEICRLILDQIEKPPHSNCNSRAVFIDAQTVPAGETALMMAAELGHCEVVKLLLARGASTKVKNQNGQTAFDKATAKGNTPVATLFLEHERSSKSISSYLIAECSIQ